MGARLRILALLMVAALLAGTVWARLAYWQVLRHVQLSASAQAQYHELVQLPALRGVIFDRNLTQLVVNTTVYSAFVSPTRSPPLFVTALRAASRACLEWTRPRSCRRSSRTRSSRISSGGFPRRRQTSCAP